MSVVALSKNTFKEERTNKFVECLNCWLQMWRVVFLLVLRVYWISCQFFDCHDDPGFDPDEGTLTDLQFTWLGALQYIHVKNGTPHYFRVPRVVLISRQFVLSTAVDAAHIPDEYALGNIVFGDYERDEEECKLTTQELADGMECEPAVLLMPIADVLLHPEFKHFGVKTSIALLKLIKPVQSKYMVPACLPFKNFLVTKNGKLTTEKIFHVDFVSDVPRDFVDEEKKCLACTCYLASFVTYMTIQNHTRFSLLGPASSSSAAASPRHLLLHPYVSWITAAITGKAVGAFAKDDPFGYVMPRASLYDVIGHRWVGHWWMGGLRCSDRGDAALDMFRFYHEVFQVKPVTTTMLTYLLEINAAHDTLIICVKVGMPYQVGQPRVWQLDTPEVKVEVPVLIFTSLYKFQVDAWAYNATESETSEPSSSSIESQSQETTNAPDKAETK